MKKAKITAIIKPMALVIYVIFVALTSIIPLRSVLLGGIPFWYDPARDMLLAWDNLHKLTLIGPPGGIPGIFYGPYWIWLLSLPMVITHNPRLVTLFAITIPYLIFFPLILWKMRSYLGVPAAFILWALFITNFDNYPTFPWSPYLAALFFLLLSFLITKKNKFFLVGIVSALIPNFNFSFGVAIVVATTAYQLLTNFRKFHRFLIGVIIIYLPVIFFELRHNFLQTRAFVDTFLKSALYNSAVVGQIGIPKDELISHFLAIPTGILHLPWEVGLIFLLWAVWKGAFKNRLTLFLLCSLSSIFLIYFGTKNPIWPYHFIGVETIFLLLIGLIISKSRILTLLAGVFSCWLLVVSFGAFFKPLVPNYLTIPTLVSKESITRFIISDAKSETYSVLAYSPAIYTYDYDYLFRWLGKGKNGQNLDNIYLIIPPTTDAVYQDFIQYKTPGESYHTLWEKSMPDGTNIIKRSKVL